MGYFDWMEEQDAAPQDDADASLDAMKKASAKKGTTPTKQGGGGSLRDLQSQENLRKIEKEGQYKSAVDAAKTALDTLPTPSGFYLESFQKIREAIDKKATPLSLADDFDRLAASVTSPAPSAQKVRSQFADIANQFRRADEIQRKAVGATALSASPAQLEEAKQRIAAIGKSEEEARAQVGSLGVTNPEKAVAENRLREFGKEREELQKLQSKYGPQEQMAGQTGSDNLNQAYTSGGMDKRQMAQAAHELAQKMAAMGFNPNGEYDFRSVLPYVLNAVGPEAVETFDRWAAEEQARGSQEVGPPTPQQVSGQKPSAEQDHQLATNENLAAQKANIKAQAEVRKQFAEAQELRSLPAIISYVLLSMVIGPRNAFLFFSNAYKKGTLAAQMQELKGEMNLLIRENKNMLRQREIARREAARQQEREEDKAHDFKLTAYRIIVDKWAKAKQAATTPEEKKYIDGLRSSFIRKSDLADKASAQFNEKLAAKYREDMDDIDAELDRLGAKNKPPDQSPK